MCQPLNACLKAQWCLTTVKPTIQCVRESTRRGHSLIFRRSIMTLTRIDVTKFGLWRVCNWRMWYDVLPQISAQSLRSFEFDLVALSCSLWIPDFPPDMQTALCILDVVHEHGLHLHLHSQLWHGTRYLLFFYYNPNHNRRMLYFALMTLSLFTVCYHVFSQLGWQAFCPQRSSIRQLGQQLTWSLAPWCGLTFSSLEWFSLFWWSVSHCINMAKKRRHILHQPKSLMLAFFYRVSWVSSASCLLQPSACCPLCMSACFCRRPRGSLCLPSQLNSTSSTSKARTKSVNHRLSISWVKCVSPQPCRQTTALLHSHLLSCCLSHSHMMDTT